MGCVHCWGVISPDHCREIAERLAEAESALNDCALIMEAQSDQLEEEMRNNADLTQRLASKETPPTESTRSPAQNGSIGRGHDMFEEAVGIGEAMARLLARTPQD